MADREFESHPLRTSARASSEPQPNSSVLATGIAEVVNRRDEKFMVSVVEPNLTSSAILRQGFGMAVPNMYFVIRER